MKTTITIDELWDGIEDKANAYIHVYLCNTECTVTMDIADRLQYWSGKFPFWSVGNLHMHPGLKLRVEVKMDGHIAYHIIGR